MPRLLTRRGFLQAGASAGILLLLPRAAGASTLVNPYTGSIPLVFPLQSGTYQTPLQNNWHVSREGQQYTWNHRDGKTIRAHDGVDVYPLNGNNLPTVYAPVSGTISAICYRTENSISVQPTYLTSTSHPPPWNYSQAVDNVANLPLYGNFVWIYSTDPASAGYFVFFCHLQYDSLIQGLAPDQAVTATTPTATPVGTMGDTGNASGTPQLHVEIHYPSGNSFTCTHCKPRKSGLTSIDPFNSLVNATPRPSH
jgi:hypothetical protein